MMECHYCPDKIEEDQMDSWCYSIGLDETIIFAHWRCLLFEELKVRGLE